MDSLQEFKASCISQEDKIEEMALITVSDKFINYEEDLIVDTGCSNHKTGDKDKLANLTEYKASCVVVTASNSRLAISHVGQTKITPRFKSEEVELENVMHVPGMKKNLSSV